MITAIIGTGGIGSAIARWLASGGESLQLSSPDKESARTLAGAIGETVAGWLPTGARLAMAFGTMSADHFESSSNRSREPAVLFYVTDDRGSDEVERLIRTAGFEPMKVGGIKQSGRLEVGGDLHDLVVGPAEARSLIAGA